WIGTPLALVAAGVMAILIAYPCFRYRIIGHYFALVTLALSGIVLQVITATRDWTGGSLGYTPIRYQGGSSLYALQFTGKRTWYLIALAVWAVGLYVWHRVDRSMLRYALEAISEDEDAAAAAGVHVTREKLKITVLSAVMTALAGALYCQYQMFISPDTVSGISVSLQMVFAVVVGGIYVSLGPTVGAVITILLAEVLRISFGTSAVGWDNVVYGILLVLFIIFLPKGILGSLLDLYRSRGAVAPGREETGAAWRLSGAPISSPERPCGPGAAGNAAHEAFLDLLGPSQQWRYGLDLGLAPLEPAGDLAVVTRVESAPSSEHPGPRLPRGRDGPP